MPGEPYIITGAKGSVAPRLEIHDLHKDQKQWAIFVQALSLLQSDPDLYKLPIASHWQQIAGIHGLPYSQWPGDPDGRKTPVDQPTGDQWLGYCHHASVLFPTWHRVSILLLEQSIWEAAQEVLKTVILEPLSQLKNSSEDHERLDKELAAWTTAAHTLRWPFWDWTANDAYNNGVPDLLRRDFIKIKVPKVSDPLQLKTLTLRNPLHSYAFQETVQIPEKFSDESDYFNKWARTYRWPTNTNSDTYVDPDVTAAGGKNIALPPFGVESPPQEDYSSILNTFKYGSKIFIYGRTIDVLDWEIRKQQVADLFAAPVADDKTNPALFPKYWNIFSNNSNDKDTKGIQDLSQDLETPHNKVHLNLGGEHGDMSYNDYAGFDPIFWLHHCNIDRLSAFWEYVYPEYWMGKGTYPDDKISNPPTPFSNDGTYDSVWGELNITEDTGLSPFRKSKTEYWTSKDAHFVPAGPNGESAKTYTYPDISVPEITVSLGKSWALKDRQRYREALKIHFTPPKQFIIPGHGPKGLPPIFKSPKKTPSELTIVEGFRQFSVVVEISKYAFRSSHRLVLLFEDVPINDVAILNRIDPSTCEACVSRQESDSKLRVSLHLPHELVIAALDHYNLNKDDTTEEAVVALLRSKISAQITSPGMGKVLAGTRLPPMGDGGDHKPLEENKRPKLTLISAAVGRKKLPIISAAVGGQEPASGSELVESHYADFQNHGPALEDEWALA